MTEEQKPPPRFKLGDKVVIIIHVVNLERQQQGTIVRCWLVSNYAKGGARWKYQVRYELPPTEKYPHPIQRSLWRAEGEITMKRMAKYRKKPLIIEATRYRTGDKGAEALVCFCDTLKGVPHIHTLEWVMVVREGDWIIIGVKGEKYPCNNDIFTLTYEKAA